jgi:dTDP-4-amino-4,6-dideoxygalactose transaminase
MMPDVGPEELKAVEDVLASGQLVEGVKAHEFEELISQTAGSKHTVLCTSATIGLEMALKVLRLKPDDEVLLPAFTHPATLLAVINVGLTPVLVDVDMATFNTSVHYLEKGLTNKTKVLMPVSWGGYPINTSEIMSFAKKNNLFVIEDAACGLGTSYNYQRTGSQADMTVFSFHPRKLIALGDGGAVSTNNEELFRRLKRIKHFGSVTLNGRASFIEPGSNYRLSNILAAMGIPQLKRLDETIRLRNEKAQIYRKLLGGLDWLNLPLVEGTMQANYQSFCISFNIPGLRDFCLKEFKEMGIEVQFGTYSIDREPFCKNVRKVGQLENSHFLGDNLLTLPLHFKLTISEQESVSQELRNLKNKFI